MKNQTGERLWIIVAEVFIFAIAEKGLEFDLITYGATADHVLDFEVC